VQVLEENRNIVAARLSLWSMVLCYSENVREVLAAEYAEVAKEAPESKNQKQHLKLFHTKDTMVARRGRKKIGVVQRAEVCAPEDCSPEESLKRARMLVRAAMPVIIGAFIEEAKGGSCQHAKFLMEFAVEEPAEERPKGTEVDPDEESLASILLRELRESEAEESVAG